MARWKKVVAGLGVVSGGSVVLCAGLFGPCWSSWLLDGILVGTCPEGDVRPVADVRVEGLGRGDVGTVTVGVSAAYWHPDARGVSTTAVRRFSADFVLVSPTGETTELEPDDDWGSYGHRRTYALRLPEVADGDWVLRVTTSSPAGDATVEAKLPLYVPALGHALTDAPLYKPGQAVRFRAVLLAEDTYAPLEGRPGVWRVTDPEGTVLLEERAQTGPYGVVAGSFPMDPDAASGTWNVIFQSGNTAASTPFDVRPFRLPKMTVEATASAPAFFPGEAPVVEGVVRYASGAPVAGARVRVTPMSTGAWPPPLAWMEEQRLVADADGRFRVTPGPVPADLVGQATLVWRFEASDEAGEITRGEARTLLSADRIAADAVTELGGGLVPSTNNRVWVRATTADGRALGAATLKMRPEGDVDAPWLTATADLDGVARFQLDPGEPITVVVPAPPVRPRPRRAVDPVRFEGAEDRLEGALDLGERMQLERWRAALAPCAAAVASGEESVTAAALITPSGRVALATASGQNAALTRCVEARLTGLAAPGGRDRLWSLRLAFPDPETPMVGASVDVAAGSDPGVFAVLDLAAARACAAGVTESAPLPRALAWRAEEGSARLTTQWVERRDVGATVSPSVAACVERAIGQVALDGPAHADGMGVVDLDVQVRTVPGEAQPAPTTWPGFAWEVVAEVAGAEVGRTVLRQPVGEVPNLRLRASEVVVDPGAKVEITALRGPDFVGTFPDELRLMQGVRELAEFDFDPEARKGTLVVPEDASGFATVEWSGARVVLYVKPAALLAVEVTPDAATYRPGATATLDVRTNDAKGGVPAGVTLSGVDATMGQLATLPTPETWAATTVRATSDAPAFGVLDARALMAGRVRGENAAQATVLRITGLPATPPGADLVHTEARGTFDADGELQDAFYAVYRRARKAVRDWEREAPEGEVLTAAKMVTLWEAAARDVPDGEPREPFGRTLHLSRLPPDLLALTDPRLMTSDGARLPEDVENWTAWVAEEAP